MSRNLVLVIVTMLVFGSEVFGASIQVRHDHDPWGKCRGELVITEDGVEYRSGKAKHNRSWSWTNIQSFDRRSPTQFRVITYEDQKFRLGQDRSFDFTVLPEGDKLDENTFQLIAQRLNKPLVDRMPEPMEGVYQLPVKHLHRFGGCEGTLFFGAERVVYSTPHSRHSRSWSRSRELSTVWTYGPYRIDIQAYEAGTAYDETRSFRFQLKEPLDEEYFDQLRRDLLPGR